MATSSSLSAKFPLVTLVVSLNKPLTFDSPLMSLRSSNYPLSRIELLLIHDSRSLTSSEVLKRLHFKTVKLIPLGHKGSFYQQISKTMTGRWVLFLNSDSRPGRSWVKEMVSTFKKDNEIGLVLGETQWRSPDLSNKVGSYCEQIGLNSAAIALGDGSPTYLTLENWGDSADQAIDPVVSLLGPLNLAMRSDVLKGVASANHSLDKGLTWEGLANIKGKKLRLFYQPGALLEQCPRLNARDLYRYCADKGKRAAVWARFRPAPRLRLNLQFLGQHEVVLPFPFSIDISWGNFHWIHFWGMVIIWQILWMSLFSRSTSNAWDTDKVLFEVALWGIFLFRYFSPVLKVQPWTNFILWCWLRYRSNMSMFCAGILASVKFRCFQWMESW